MEQNIKLMQKEIKQKINCLNSGGCIHFAYYFTKRLKELNIPYKVYSFNYEATGKTYHSFVPVDHITVFIDGIGFVDGYETLYKKNERYKCHIKLKDLNILRWKSGWNCQYNTRQNKLLESIINTYI